MPRFFAVSDAKLCEDVDDEELEEVDGEELEVLEAVWKVVADITVSEPDVIDVASCRGTSLFRKVARIFR